MPTMGFTSIEVQMSVCGGGGWGMREKDRDSERETVFPNIMVIKFLKRQFN